MTVVIVKLHETETWHPGPPVFVAAAENEEAAKRWIEMTVAGPGYDLPNKDADWWIEYGVFSLTEVEVAV